MEKNLCLTCIHLQGISKPKENSKTISKLHLNSLIGFFDSWN